jgi:hypothetical protein
MEFFINGEKMDIDSDIPDIEVDQPTHDFKNIKPLNFSVEGKLNYKDFKRLFKLPRKKKKRFGTLKAKKRLLKRVRLGLPLSYDDIKRAGYELKMAGGE